MLRLYRFGKEIVSPQPHCEKLFVEVAFGGKEHDRDVDEGIKLPNDLGQIRAIAFRHIKIDQDQIRGEFKQMPQSRQTGY